MLIPVRPLVAVAAVAIATTSCTGSGGSGGNLPPWAAAAAVSRLVTYQSCDDVLDELTGSVADLVGPYGLDGGVGILYSGRSGGGEDGGPVPAADTAANGLTGSGGMPAGPAPGGAAEQSAQTKAYSGTNVHEAGVDEPDLVKTDGRRLLTVTDGVLRVVDVTARRVVGELSLPDGVWPDQMLLHGDRAVLVARGTFYPMDKRLAEDTGIMAPDAAMPTMLPVGTRLTVVDISGRPSVVSTVDLDTEYVDARQVGSVVRVVLRSYPRLKFIYPEPGKVSEREATAANRKTLRESKLADWLPDYAQTTRGLNAAKGELVDCTAVHHVPDAPATTMLTVMSLDLAGDLQVNAADSVSVATGGETVYGTGSSLYVAEGSFGKIVPLPAADQPLAGRVESDEQRTRIHRFDVSTTGRPQYTASGSVAGYLLNQYSMSEFDGSLRVATTRQAFGAGACCERQDQSDSVVTVLAERGDELVPIGAVDGLGKGEQIYAVRFIGPVGYVVTFRQTDPLYTLDLSDPRNPRVAGELEITGYSAYLHPAGSGRLIGVGQEATAEGRTLGTQVSLFDVSNPAAPRRLASYHLSGASSEAEFDPHAFLYWPADQTVVVPVQGGFSPVADAKMMVGGGALVLRINGSGIDEIGMVSHLPDPSRIVDYMVDPSIRRSVVIGESLWTVSAAGVLANDLDDLDGQIWIPFSRTLVKDWPQPVPLPEPVPVPPTTPEPLPTPDTPPTPEPLPDTPPAG